MPSKSIHTFDFFYDIPRGLPFHTSALTNYTRYSLMVTVLTLQQYRIASQKADRFDFRAFQGVGTIYFDQKLPLNSTPNFLSLVPNFFQTGVNVGGQWTMNTVVKYWIFIRWESFCAWIYCKRIDVSKCDGKWLCI